LACPRAHRSEGAWSNSERQQGGLVSLGEKEASFDVQKIGREPQLLYAFTLKSMTTGPIFESNGKPGSLSDQPNNPAYL